MKTIQSQLRRTTTLFIFLFFLLANIALRNGTFRLPMVDRHNFRQTDTYAMIQLLHRGQTDVLHPRFYQAPDYNNSGHFYFAEFPLYQWIVSSLFHVFGEHLIIARLVNVILFSIICFAVYLIGRKLLSEKAGILAGMFCMVYPASFFWGRSVTPDILGLAGFTLATALIMNSTRRSNLTISALLAVAVLVKPFYLLFIPVHFIGILLESANESKKHTGLPDADKIRTIVIRLARLYAVPLALFAAWRLWILSFPPAARSDPNISWLMDGMVGYLRFWRESGWVSIFVLERFFGELLTPFGGILSALCLGAIATNTKPGLKHAALVLWCASSTAVVLLISAGTKAHDYYAIHWLPIAALTGAAFVRQLYLVHRDSNIAIRLSILLSFIFGFYFLGYLPFIRYEQDYFENVTDMYSASYIQDYDMLKNSIATGTSVLFVTPYYTPFPLNMIERFGYIIAAGDKWFCSAEQNPVETIREFAKKGVSFVVIPHDNPSLRTCLDSTHPEFRDYLNARVRKTGNHFSLYSVAP